MNRYLETGYLVADQGERALFVELLGFEDDELSAVLMVDVEVPEEMKILVGKIHNFYVD
ncbi:MAG: succinate dehydrogenase assembly factor 2 [Methylobacter sp.]|nr:succinate dehydrogenase assembly factor 2 [Methylobacter sp.]